MKILLDDFMIYKMNKDINAYFINFYVNFNLQEIQKQTAFWHCCLVTQI